MQFVTRSLFNQTLVLSTSWARRARFTEHGLSSGVISASMISISVSLLKMSLCSEISSLSGLDMIGMTHALALVLAQVSAIPSGWMPG